MRFRSVEGKKGKISTPHGKKNRPVARGLKGRRTRKKRKENARAEVSQGGFALSKKGKCQKGKARPTPRKRKKRATPCFSNDRERNRQKKKEGGAGNPPYYHAEPTEGRSSTRFIFLPPEEDKERKGGKEIGTIPLRGGTVRLHAKENGKKKKKEGKKDDDHFYSDQKRPTTLPAKVAGKKKKK